MDCRSPFRPDGGSEDGFTLVELIIVVLVIGVLLAIAIPTFLGTRRRAEDRQAQSSLRTALAAAKIHYLDDATYSSFSVAEAEAVEASLTWLPSATMTTGPSEVTIRKAAGINLLLIAKSRSGTYFGIAQGAGLTTYCDSDSVPSWNNPNDCLDARW